MTLKRLFSLVLLLFLSIAPSNKVFALDKPECLKILSTAARFENKLVGRGVKQSKLYKAYEDAFKQSDKIRKADFVWLLQYGTPAGKIYAAMLLKGTGKATDCEIMMEKVCSVAQSFIKSGDCIGIKMLKKKTSSLS